MLRISSDASIPKVVVADTVPGNPSVAVLPLRPGSDDYRPNFLAGALPNPIPFLPTAPIIHSHVRHDNRMTKFFSVAHVSRDGHDLVILTTTYRVVSSGTLNASVVAKPASSILGRSWASCREMSVFIWRLSMGAFAWLPSVYFPTHFLVAHTHASPPFLPLSLAFFCSILGFTLSTSKGALPLTRSKSYSCDPASTTRSAACSSPIVAFT